MPGEVIDFDISMDNINHGKRFDVAESGHCGPNDSLATTLACHKSQYSISPSKTVIGKIKLGRIMDYAVTKIFDILNDLGMTLKLPFCNFNGLQ